MEIFVSCTPTLQGILGAGFLLAVVCLFAFAGFLVKKAGLTKTTLGGMAMIVIGLMVVAVLFIAAYAIYGVALWIWGIIELRIMILGILGWFAFYYVISTPLAYTFCRRGLLVRDTWVIYPPTSRWLPFTDGATFITWCLESLLWFMLVALAVVVIIIICAALLGLSSLCMTVGKWLCGLLAGMAG